MTGTISPHTPAPPRSPVLAETKPPVVSAAAPTAVAGDVSKAASSWRRDSRVVATLVSTIVHTVLLLVLALWTYHIGGRGEATLKIRQGEPSTSLQWTSLQSDADRLRSNALPLEVPVAVSIQMAPQTETVSPLKADAQSVETLDPSELGIAGRSDAASAARRLPSGGGLSGRTPEGRQELGSRYGATEASEQAVELALQWLARHQRGDGSWSFDLELNPCNGRCRHGKPRGTETPTPSTAATGLSLLAFLGAGHTPWKEGPYQETVRRGVYYLRGVAAEANPGYDWQQGSMYGHGIALMALGEALAMEAVDDPRTSELYDLVQQGASFTSVAQHHNGSWGYVPGSPGDTTVTGWQVLSLIAARRCDVPFHTNTLRDAKAFLLSVTGDRQFWFGYKGPPGEPTTTAIGLTMMLYLGESPAYTPLYIALTDLAERGPTLTNIYHDYYASLALHHSRHHLWDQWNRKLREHLIKTQATSGHERGSWHFEDRWGDIGGRLYTTAMCTLTLEIYYRYLPLYRDSDDFPL